MYKLLIDKMKVVNSNPVEYYFLINDSWRSVNELIGKKISFIWSGYVFCFCNKKMKKFYKIYKWKELDKENYKIHNFKTKKTLMIFNYLIKKGDKIEYKLKQVKHAKK